MHVWLLFKVVPWIFGHLEKNKSLPSTYQGNSKNASTIKYKRSPEVGQTYNSAM